jgi:hypothetical protein
MYYSFLYVIFCFVSLFLLATTHYQKVRYIGGAADINNGYIMGVCVYVYIHAYIHVIKPNHANRTKARAGAFCCNYP